MASLALSLPRRLRQGQPLHWAVFALVCVLVVYPLVVIVINSFYEARPDLPGVYSFAAWGEALSDPSVGRTLINTLEVTVARQAISFPIAILIAWVLARTDIPGAHAIEFLFWLAFFLPALPSALGWIVLLDPEVGLLNQLATLIPSVDKGPFNIFSFWGLIWTHLMTGTIAIKVMLMTPVFRNMDATLEEASKVAGASALGTLVRVFIPIMTPVLLVSLVLGVVYSLQTFELEAVLGPPFEFYVFSTHIYFQINHDPPQYGQATALSSIILAFMVPLILLERWGTGRRSFAVVGGGFKGHKVRLRRWRITVLCLVLGAALLMTGVPFAFLLLSTFMKFFGFFNLSDVWTTDHWSRIFADGTFMASVKSTLVLAFGSAILAVALMTVVAYVIVRTQFVGRRILDFVSWLPAAIPGIILGLGFLWLVLQNPFLRPLYGTTLLLMIVVVVASMPMCVQLIKVNFGQLGLELEAAARVAGGTWWDMFRRVLLPLITPTLLLVATVTFVAASRNVSSVALLAIGSSRPLSLLQLDFMFDGQYESAAVVGVIIVGLTAGIAFLARTFGLRVGISGSS